MLKLSVATVLVGMILGACGGGHHRPAVAVAAPVRTPEPRVTVTKADGHADTTFIACAAGSVNMPADCVTPSGVDLQALKWQTWGASEAVANGTVHLPTGARVPVYVRASGLRSCRDGGLRYTRLTVSSRAGSRTEKFPGCSG
ncbi:MAG: hypothetical protein QOF76_1666 [Solirubrobacteraceae bacterium]|jgi:hypothetical protein|nr:hypothetical protein [Solirubrobacteraceae bacterium]